MCQQQTVNNAYMGESLANRRGVFSGLLLVVGIYIVACGGELLVSAATYSGGTMPYSGGVGQSWIGGGERVQEWQEEEPAERVRLSLRHSGLYRVTLEELAVAGGWLLATVEQAATSGNLLLTSRGVTNAWSLGSDNSLLFYGMAPESQYAPESVYWVSLEQGETMAAIDGSPLGFTGGTNEWFSETISFYGTDYPARQGYSSFTNEPYVTFSPVFKAEREENREALYTVSLPAVALGEWEATVSVRLLSYYHGPERGNHKAQISLGSTVMGVEEWYGEQIRDVSFSFSSTNISNDKVTIKIRNVRLLSQLETDDSLFILTGLRFNYRRRYRAVENLLCWRGGEKLLTEIEGFTAEPEVVLDLSTPFSPVIVENFVTSYDSASSSWRVVVAAGGGGSQYLAASVDGTLKPSVRGARSRVWGSEKSGPEFAIIIPPRAWRDDFKAAVEVLVERRNGQGIATEIYDVEDIYNSFSDGMADPWAIRDFAATMYGSGLRYILLVGSGSLDFLHRRVSVNDYTAALIPTPVAGQRFVSGEGLTAAVDGILGDIDGDGCPDVIIARLPTADASAVATIISKTINYENSLHWRRPVALTADWQNEGKFGDGTSILTATQINLPSWHSPMIMMAMGCRASRWQGLTTTVGAAVKGLYVESGGFVASIGSTADIMGNDGEAFGVALYSQMERTQTVRLGDMVLGAYRELSDKIPFERLYSISLTGDPTLIVHKPPAGTVISIY